MRRIFPEAPLTEAQRNKRFYDNHREQELERNRIYCRDNKEKVAIRRRLYRHQITQEWIDAKLIEQDNKCAICHKLFERTPHIDHDHKCCPKLKSCDKCRRGLLCEGCNIGLGMLQENPEILSNAIKYVNSYKKEQ